MILEVETNDRLCSAAQFLPLPEFSRACAVPTPKTLFQCKNKEFPKLTHCCVRVESLFVINEEKACAPDHQEILNIVWHKASELKYLRFSSHLGLPKRCNTLSDAIIFGPRSNITARSSGLLYTGTEMNSDLNVGGQYSELAISAINLNAESQGQDNSSLAYCRLFSSGKPVTEFYCKACQESLGHLAPDNCGRCRPYAENLGSLERMVVGFTQFANEVVMGEYLISAELFDSRIVT